MSSHLTVVICFEHLTVGHWHHVEYVVWWASQWVKCEYSQCINNCSMTVDFSLNSIYSASTFSWDPGIGDPTVTGVVAFVLPYKLHAMQITKAMTMINQLIPWQHKSPQWQQILHGMLHNSRTSGLKQPHLGNVNYPDAIFFDNRPSNKNDISISVRHWPSMFCSVRTSLTRSTAFPMASSNLNTGENSDTFKKLPWPWQWPKQVRIRARTTTGWPNLSQWMSNCLPLMRLWWHDLCQLGHY